jgi:hypothetical protein
MTEVWPFSGYYPPGRGEGADARGFQGADTSNMPPNLDSGRISPEASLKLWQE